MKNLFLFLVIFVVAAPLAAQENFGIKRLEVSAGTYTSKDLHVFLRDDFWNLQNDRRLLTPSIFASLSFFRNKKFEFAIDLGFQNSRVEYSDNFSGGALPDSGTLNYNFYTVLPNARINWISSKENSFELYSSWGIGLTYVYRSSIPESAVAEEVYQLLAFHLNVVGVRFGNKVGGFFELGAGTQGLINGGLSLRL